MSDKYTTSRGFEIEFVSIPQSIRKFHLSHVEPKPPTYTVHSKLTGADDVFFHDVNTIETDEEKAQWQAYQVALNEYNEKFLRVCLIKGIRVHASMDEWIAEQEALEIPVPENPIERRIEWITENILATKEDFQAVMTGVMRASGAPEDLLVQIESLFRGEVEQSNGENTERTASDADRRELVLQSPIRGSVDGVRNGDTTKPIRQVEQKRQGTRPSRKTRKSTNGGLGERSAIA